VDPSEELLFSRSLLLADFDDAALARLRQARVLVLGAGGLGCPVAQYLACGGVGHLHWVDGDDVDLSNLPRQTLFGPADQGQPKVKVGARRLNELAPHCQIQATVAFADEANLPAWIDQADLVVDCTDRFATRQLINRCCVRLGKRLVIASVIQWTGQLLMVDPADEQAACYACLFDPQTPQTDAACGAYGVFSTAAGLLGLMQAHEALKWAAGFTVRTGQLHLVDTKTLQFDRIQVPKKIGCPVCGHPPSAQ
jgi:molybdopterin/thiamine biosynthesis adenylyltransferase